MDGYSSIVTPVIFPKQFFSKRRIALKSVQQRLLRHSGLFVILVFIYLKSDFHNITGKHFCAKYRTIHVNHNSTHPEAISNLNQTEIRVNTPFKRYRI